MIKFDKQIVVTKMTGTYFNYFFDSPEKILLVLKMLKFSQFRKTNFTKLNFSLKLQGVEYCGWSQSKYFDF